MSYARSPSEGDVYVIGTGSGDTEHWECMGCDLLPVILRPAWDMGEGMSGPEHYDTRIFAALSPGQMFTHLRLHVAAGQAVPERAFKALAAEHIEWQSRRDAEFAALMKPTP